MKKVLAVLVVLMFATSAFALVGTETKLLSQAGLPAELTTDNIIISNTFIQKIGDFGQLAGIEYIGQPFGYIVTKTGLGTIGLSSSPSLGMVTAIGANLPNYMFGLQWANDGGLGIGLLLGTQNMQYDFTKDAGYNNDPDTSIDNRLMLGLKLGLTVSGIDLGLGLNWLNNTNEVINHYDPSGNKMYDDTTARGEIDINLAARMEMSEMLWVLKVGIALGNQTITTKDDGNDDGNVTDGTDTNTVATQDDSDINVNLLCGKIIKASESLKVTVGTGISFDTYGTIQTSFDNKNGGNTTYGPLGANWTYQTINIPLFVAVEGKLNETWRVNAGASVTPVNLQLQSWNLRAANTDKTAAKKYYGQENLNIGSYTNFGLGVTGLIGDLQLDLRMNPGILLNGPDFLSGAGPGSLAYSCALIYGWK